MKKIKAGKAGTQVGNTQGHEVKLSATIQEVSIENKMGNND